MSDVESAEAAPDLLGRRPPLPGRPGRPRSARAERAILDATSDLLIERGFQGLSVEEVAERAGVGKATIYRRWSSKDELVRTAVCVHDDFVPPDTGSVRGDFLAILGARRTSAEPRLWPMMARIVGEAIGNPAFLGAYWDAVVRPRRAIGTAIIRRGKARGEVRPDVDEELVLDALVGFVIYRLLVSPEHTLPATSVVEEFVDTLCRGIAAP
ncbi:MAG TPA: TetR/AcrR family transcriptional regulator [Thermomicrobiaceae bacterium]|nr:TetR/AcrR family transcriptional regulator [Thermomicrobiaceae bacterium]